jgi:hypothetical protein
MEQRARRIGILLLSIGLVVSACRQGGDQPPAPTARPVKAARYQPVQSVALTEAAAATLPTPSGSGSGLSLSTWLMGGTGYGMAEVVLTAAGSSTVTSATLYGFEPVTNEWVTTAALNNGNSISLTATLGYDQAIEMPQAFTRLDIGGTVSGSNVGYTLIPIAEVP